MSTITSSTQGVHLAAASLSRQPNADQSQVAATIAPHERAPKTLPFAVGNGQGLTPTLLSIGDIKAGLESALSGVKKNLENVFHNKPVFLSLDKSVLQAGKVWINLPAHDKNKPAIGVKPVIIEPPIIPPTPVLPPPTGGGGETVVPAPMGMPNPTGIPECNGTITPDGTIVVECVNPNFEGGTFMKDMPPSTQRINGRFER